MGIIAVVTVRTIPPLFCYLTRGCPIHLYTVCSLCEHGSHFFFHDCAREEIRVGIPPEMYRIGDHEVAEILDIYQAIFRQLIRFVQNIAHISYIKMPNVRAE